MFRVLAASCLIGLTWGAGVSFAESSNAAQDPNDLCVMTYNLRFASPVPPHAWPQRRPIMAELIRNAAPDVLGTQEGTYPQLKDLHSDLPGYEWIGLGREGGSRGEFMAVFYRRDRLAPQEFDYFWLSDTPNVIASSTWGNTCRRMVTWVRFLDRRTQRQFCFIDTHFDHEVQRAREKSAELVLDRAKKFKDGLPVILVGDFNASAGANKAYSILVGPDAFVDTWSSAKERGENWATFGDFGPPRKNGRRIDWILTRGPVTVLRTEILTFSKNGQYPSDHFPVIARIRW